MTRVVSVDTAVRFVVCTLAATATGVVVGISWLFVAAVAVAGCR